MVLFTPQRILVTGGAGFIGSNFVRQVLAESDNAEIYNLDCLSYAGSEDNLQDLPSPGRHLLIEGDINDTEIVRQLLVDHQIDTVVNFAAESHVDRSIAAPDAFIRSNILGVFQLLECIVQVWGRAGDRVGRRYIQISTDEVYGSLDSNANPCDEAHRYAPNSPYSASKAAADHLVRAYGKTYDLPVITTNCSNNYGPYQHPEKLIPLIITRARQGMPLPIYGDGQQIRDWLFVSDHCRAIWSVVQQGQIGETYNIGGNCELTNLEVVTSICDLLDELVPASTRTNYRNLIQHVDDRPGHDRRYALDCKKIRTQLAWTPSETFSSGLRKTVEWYLAHEDWVAKRTQTTTA